MIRALFKADTGIYSIIFSLVITSDKLTLSEVNTTPYYTMRLFVFQYISVLLFYAYKNLLHSPTIFATLDELQ